MAKERLASRSANVGRSPFRLILLGPAEKGRSALADALLGAADGQALVHEIGPPAPTGETELTKELAQAEAIILTADIARTLEPIALESEITELERTLTWLEQQRGAEVLISGLPVFIALTQSETLAKENDTLADWIDRVQHQVRALDERLQPFRQRRLTAGQPFGEVDLQTVRATAVQRPPTAGDDTAGFGIAELLRQCLDQAAEFRRRRRQGARRLVIASLAALLVLATVILAGVAQRWKDTEADRQATATAIEARIASYQSILQTADALERFGDCPKTDGAPVPWTKWYKEVEVFLAGAEPPAHRPDEKLPGADHATWADVMLAEPVGVARVEWLTMRERLENRRDLIAALGVVTSPDRPSPLKLKADLNLAGVTVALDELAKIYPRYKEWTLERLPRNAVRDLEKTIEAREAILIKIGQDEVLLHLEKALEQTDAPAGQETLPAWHKVADWLAKPVELTAWRELTNFLARLNDPGAVDPVDALRSFLQQGQFDIELQRLVLRIPISRKLRPDGKLSVFRGNGEEAAFKQLGEPRRTSDALLYTFVPEAGETVMLRLIYRPGNTFWVELPVLTEDKQSRRLTWSVCRSMMYQFERLLRPPRIHRPDQLANQGELAADVSLMVSIGTVPRVPELLPVVRLGKR